MRVADTVPAWLHPGESVISHTWTRLVGERTAGAWSREELEERLIELDAFVYDAYTREVREKIGPITYVRTQHYAYYVPCSRS